MRSGGFGLLNLRHLFGHRGVVPELLITRVPFFFIGNVAAVMSSSLSCCSACLALAPSLRRRDVKSLRPHVVGPTSVIFPSCFSLCVSSHRNYLSRQSLKILLCLFRSFIFQLSRRDEAQERKEIYRNVRKTELQLPGDWGAGGAGG